MAEAADAVVIGGGMAGVSVAYELAESLRVLLVEAEATLAHHTTGRSAALYAPSYGDGTVRALTKASLEDYRRLGRDLADARLLAEREVLWIAAPADVASLEAAVADLGGDEVLCPIPPAEALSKFPALRPEMLGAAAVEAGTADIDVAGLHQCYVRGLRARRGEILRTARVSGIEQVGTTWVLRSGDLELHTPVVVNAAGAWADEVAALAGLQPVGLRPLRRTLFASPLRDWPGSSTWPWLAEVGERFYCRPEQSQVVGSPADETPSEPCDARPDPLDVAAGLEAVNEYTRFALRSVTAAWAGLRTFAPDGSPVVGWDGQAGGFFWMAGQGGYGIQMAPALARCAAALVAGRPLPLDEVTAEMLSPERFSAR